MFNGCLEMRWKTANCCILNFSFYNYFVWEVISSIWHNVSSPDETPWSSSKIFWCASYFKLSSQCFIWWWNTASHAWCITRQSPKDIHHFHIDHNAPCLLYPPKFCITIALDFSREDCYTLDDKLETIIKQNLGGVNKVHYGLCESSELRKNMCRVS